MALKSGMKLKRNVGIRDALRQAAENTTPAPMGSQEQADIFDNVRKYSRDREKATFSDPVYVQDAMAFPGMDNINDAQVRYVSADRENVDSAIPATLWQSTMTSLDRIRNSVGGSVDDYIMDRMDWSRSELEDYLSPEQRDALAMMIHGFDSGSSSADRGFLLGDTTGFGKGRPLMAYAAYCRRNGVFPIVFTKQENLFSNLWCDIVDMNLQGDFRRPFPMNAGSTIMNISDPDGSLYFPKVKPSVYKAIIEEGVIPDEFGIMFATYSQINQENSKRMQFITSLMDRGDCSVILDESQEIVHMRAATSINVGKLLERCYSSINSSATSARDIDNMASYVHVYPWLSALTSYDIGNMKAEHRIWLSSLSVIRAVSEGRMIRREHDMSGHELEIHKPSDDVVAKVSVIADQFASVCSKLREFHLVVAGIADKYNEPVNKGHGEQMPDNEYSVIPEFQRLFPLSRQFMACAIVDHMVDRCVQSLKNGEKPFAVMDMTMEAAMTKIIEDEIVAGDGDGAEAGEDNDDVARKPMTLKDLCRLTFEKMREINVRKRAGTQGPPVSEKIIVDGDVIETFDVFREDVMRAIDGMDDLPASPFDEIRRGIEARGEELFRAGEIEKPWKVCEISGRSRRIVDGHYEPVPDIDRNTIISGFNSGHFDAVNASRSASTGLSAHASVKFHDQRPRRMIEGIGCDNPLERSQMFGRIDRRGQVHKPRYETINIGIPYNLVKIAMDNAKSRELSASVSANGNSSLMAEIPDILSDDGNIVAMDIMARRPELAKNLGMSNVSESECAATMFRRSFILPSRDQKVLMDEFREMLDLRIKDASFRMQTSLGDGWRVSGQVLAEPGRSDTDGVFVSRIERDVERQSFSSRNIPSRVSMPDDIRACLDVIGDDRLNREKEAHLLRYKPPFIKSVAAGLHFYRNSIYPAFNDNAVGRENAKIRLIADFLQEARRGTTAILRDEYGRVTPAVIASVSVPNDRERMFDWHQYQFRYVIPGTKNVFTISMASIAESGGRFRIENDRKRVFDAFDAMPSGPGTQTAYICDGPDPAAIILRLAQSGCGKMMEWTDDRGILRSSVMLGDDEFDTFMKTPARVWNYEAASRIMCAGNPMFLGREGRDGVSVRYDRGVVCFRLPEKESRRRAFRSLGFTLAKMTGQKPTDNVFNVNADDEQVTHILEEIGKDYPVFYNASTDLELIRSRIRDTGESITVSPSLSA